MSVLGWPRILFRGQISWDPGLANNSELFDAERVELVAPAGVTPDRLKQHIIDNIPALGIWNYYGTHDATFEKVAVTGGIVGPGQQLVTTDPLLGKSVQLSGKLVDIDAATVHGSQIFMDRLTIGDAAVGLRGRSAQRAHSRWINFARNLDPLPIAGIAAVVWQTVVPKDAVQFLGTAQSPLLKALADATAQDGARVGVMLRFQTYRTLYFQNGLSNNVPQQPRTLEELQALYRQGMNFSNPAYSVLVGVLGLCAVNEPRTWPGGRYLAPVETVASARRRREGTVVEEPVRLGPAVVEIDEGRRTLSIDLGSTVPETGMNLEKANLGDLEIVVEALGQSTLVARVPFEAYRKESYELRAGIVDLVLPEDTVVPQILEKVRAGRLVVRCLSDGKPRVALREVTFVVSADQRDVYLDEREERVVELRVFMAGQLAPAGTKVGVSSYGRDLMLIGPVSILSVDDGGIARFRIRAERPGIVSYVFAPFGAGETEPAPAGRLDMMASYFINVRTLPFDDAFEQSIPNANLTWAFVYDRILRVYDVLNPVMGRMPGIGKPLDSQEHMENLATAIKRAIAKEAFERPEAMPVTRDLSNGRRRLLERWCSLVLDQPVSEGTGVAGIAARALLRDPRRA